MMFGYRSSGALGRLFLFRRAAYQLNTRNLKKEKIEMSNTAPRGGSATSTKTTTTGEMTFVHTFVKNSFDEVWTYIQPFQGKLRAHVRIFTTGDDDNMR